jgi:hypothetical protein
VAPAAAYRCRVRVYVSVHLAVHTEGVRFSSHTACLCILAGIRNLLLGSIMMRSWLGGWLADLPVALPVTPGGRAIWLRARANAAANAPTNQAHTSKRSQAEASRPFQ